MTFFSLTVPGEQCLLGCVFYICDYQSLVGEEETNTWTQVVLLFVERGGEHRYYPLLLLICILLPVLLYFNRTGRKMQMRRSREL